MENGVDLSYLTKNESIKTILINMIHQGAIGDIIEVDSFGGDKIQIWVE
jgi:methionine synthase I (cobalamin-dependent)